MPEKDINTPVTIRTSGDPTPSLPENCRGCPLRFSTFEAFKEQHSGNDQVCAGGMILRLVELANARGFSSVIINRVLLSSAKKCVQGSKLNPNITNTRTFPDPDKLHESDLPEANS